MMKKEMLWWPVLGIGARLFGAFPVDRDGADLKALRTATEWVRRGDALVMFPEGRRSRTGGMTPSHPGTGLIALRTEATILPVAITGTEGTPWPWFIFMPFAIKQVHVTIGEPFRLPSVRRINSETATQATDTIMRHIAALLPPQYRGIYADVEAEPEREVPAEAKEYTKR
jgi:1-acyl-sn-glycerol-3-phosphate acyltransferase